ncbi:alcohol dehydrogenase GroES-like domain protein [Mycobacterium avium MAV_120709_2344]|nr:alcohol dehydrogenase GroES-like domain protein [Mycobacterium avium MAV_120709_2344]
MPTHQAVQIQSAGAALELVDTETRPPGRDEVRLTVGACGICGTDAHFVNGAFPGLSWPLTPGHEIAGRIAELARVSKGSRSASGSRSAGSAGAATGATLAAQDFSSTA